MKVKEVIRTVALLLNREDVIEYLDSGVAQEGSDTVKTVNVLVELLNLVVSELSSTYIPAVKSERVSLYNGKVNYSVLSEQVLKILHVIDDNGKEIDFTQYNEFFTFGCPSATVEYEYLPKVVGIDDELCYSESKIEKRVLSYGTLAEYAITEGEFDEAVMWHKRYVDGVEAICLPQNKKVKRRRWV